MLELNHIYKGDSLALLKELPDKSIDLIITDPPYDMDCQGGVVNSGDFVRKLTHEKHINFIVNDFDFESYAKEWIRVCKKVNLYIFCSNAQISRTMSYFENLGYSVTLLTWVKPNPIPLCNNTYVSNLEFIICVREKGCYFNNDLPVNKKLKTFKYPSPTERIHPTQKPIGLIEDLLKRKSKEGDVVLDCFSGSGVVAIACHNLKRNFICMEKDDEFYHLSCEWLKKVRIKKRLF